MELQVEGLGLRYGRKDPHKALDDVSFTVADGSFASILGESGAGKSTVLKVIAGILPQDEGTVSCDGVPIDALPAHKRNMGFLFQDIRLFPHMNVIENVAYPLKVRGVDRRTRIAVAQEYLERVRLGGYDRRPVRSLSGGQAQRVALARALASTPRLLLLDEPFSGLDESLRDDMRSLLLKLVREESLTTLMVTHDAHEALRMSDMIVAMESGVVKQVATPQELYTRPTTPNIASCFGDCSTLPGRVEDGRFARGGIEISLAKAEGACAAEYAGDAVAILRTCGVSCDADRPAHFERIGEAPLKCCVFDGSCHIARFDVEGETLSARTAQVSQSDAASPVFADPSEIFVYPA